MAYRLRVIFAGGREAFLPELEVGKTPEVGELIETELAGRVITARVQTVRTETRRNATGAFNDEVLASEIIEA